MPEPLCCIYNPKLFLGVWSLNCLFTKEKLSFFWKEFLSTGMEGPAGGALIETQTCVKFKCVSPSPSERPHYPIVYLGCSPLQERCLGLEGASRTPARSTLLGMGNLYSAFWSSDYLGISSINCFIQNTSNLVHKNSFTMGCMIRTVKCS